eukprot:TRINITY_DN3595_c0_g1_i1.p1 TRINITY_DN3595_c0_g1~~TRINITY_DN3595_c0_g1_i1.p1  ORF type:complete len:249 (-),score=75.90 TRINITY_DN3595_c0_g1_i1:25-771(-)
MYSLRTLSLRLASPRVVTRCQTAAPVASQRYQAVTLPRVRHFTSSHLLYSEKPAEEKKEEEEEDNDVQEPQVDDVADADPEPNHKDLLIQRLEKQLEEFNASLKAATAENESVKKIMARDVSRAREMGIDKLAKKLFPMSDTLDICLQNKPDFSSEQHKDNVHAQRAFDGIQAAKSQLVSILKGANIEEVIPARGEAFDPTYHDALFEVDPPADKSLPPGTIGMILKAGWKRDSTLLRPACVGVVRKY